MDYWHTIKPLLRIDFFANNSRNNEKRYIGMIYFTIGTEHICRAGCAQLAQRSHR